MARVASPRTRGLLVVVDPAAALVELPRQGLRVAADPRARTASLNWAARAVRAQGPGLRRAWRSWLVVRLPLAAVHDPADLRRPRADPGSLLEASADLGGAGWTTFRRVILPLVLPAVVAGSIFTFSLTLGDYITPRSSRRPSSSATSIYDCRRRRQPAARGGVLAGPGRDHARVPARRPAPRRVRGALMGMPRWRPDRAADRDGRDPRVHLHPDRDHRPVRVQREPVAGLADHRVHARLVRQGARRHRASGRRS